MDWLFTRYSHLCRAALLPRLSTLDLAGLSLVSTCCSLANVCLQTFLDTSSSRSSCGVLLCPKCADYAHNARCHAHALDLDWLPGPLFDFVYHWLFRRCRENCPPCGRYHDGLARSSVLDEWKANCKDWSADDTGAVWRPLARCLHIPSWLALSDSSDRGLLVAHPLLSLSGHRRRDWR